MAIVGIAVAITEVILVEPGNWPAEAGFLIAIWVAAYNLLSIFLVKKKLVITLSSWIVGVLLMNRLQILEPISLAISVAIVVLITFIN